MNVSGRGFSGSTVDVKDLMYANSLRFLLVSTDHHPKAKLFHVLENIIEAYFPLSPMSMKPVLTGKCCQEKAGWNVVRVMKDESRPLSLVEYHNC